ncbi:hypothetical protein DSM104299_01096 [Baekduia alba]|uniref:hypothetical protein n=1 Tax=Baekduia alba TaxID=2997333 RepID=UPI00233FFE1F|nr:hypothetical protein [Baekduia alba]WCB92402.1 hypothetical protein DSM104299_01096 [Baekduia alba]
MATAQVKRAPPSPRVPSESAPSRRRLWPPSSRATLLLGLLGLVLVAVVSYAWYVRHGGLFDDDWAVTSSMIANRADGGGFWAGVSDLWSVLSWRPVLVAYNALVVAPLGWHITAQLIWSVAVSTVFVGLLFQLLRVRGIPSPHAFAVAALVLVSTFGDAGVLWISGATIRFAGALYLAGLLLALSAFDTQDRGRALRRHVGAGVLYALSILSYEVTAGFVGAGILVYLTAAPPGRALRRWGADLAVSAAALAWSATQTPRPTHSLSASLDHARAIAREFWKAYDGAVAPGWFPSHAAGVLTLVALAVGLVCLALRARKRIAGAQVDAICLWAVVLVVALVYVAAAYVVFVPGDAYYLPNGVGTSNRINSLPTAPTLLLGYAAVMVLASALLSLRRRWVPAALAVGLLYAAGMFVTHERALHAEQRVWAGDYAASRGVLDTVALAVPHPAKGTYVVVVGAPAVRPSGNPLFYASWDLDAAVKKLYGDGSLKAINAYQGVSCQPDGLAVTGGSSDAYNPNDPGGETTGSLTTDYRRTVLVDAVHQTAYALSDGLGCQRASSRIAGG